jgi:hypothetical protein
MTENAVKQEVLQLPEADRAELARFLIESLDFPRIQMRKPHGTQSSVDGSSKSNMENRVSVPRIRCWRR